MTAGTEVARQKAVTKRQRSHETDVKIPVEALAIMKCDIFVGRCETLPETTWLAGLVAGDFLSGESTG
jgi:hypothetical protein